MARPRKTPAAAKPSAWERRNARARAEGFKNYYEKRTRQTPGAAKPKPDELARRRGHSGAADLKRLVKSGRVEQIIVIQTGFGKTPTFDVLVILSDGTQKSYVVKGEAAAARMRDFLSGPGGGPIEGVRIVGSPKGVKKFTEDAELAAEIAHEEELRDLGEPETPYVYDDSTPFD